MRFTDRIPPNTPRRALVFLVVFQCYFWLLGRWFIRVLCGGKAAALAIIPLVLFAGVAYTGPKFQSVGIKTLATLAAGGGMAILDGVWVERVMSFPLYVGGVIFLWLNEVFARWEVVRSRAEAACLSLILSGLTYTLVTPLPGACSPNMAAAAITTLAVWYAVSAVCAIAYVVTDIVEGRHSHVKGNVGTSEGETSPRKEEPRKKSESR